ncbi:MAG TPA: BatA domain-containing protein [Bryobacteraceae bacterium]|nr:BatA domain-containing protein [Bryobacteraceae bacterium]
MGFLAPWFLAGALAVGLPIWIHLLKRHKTDPRLFPSLMFFEKREMSSVKHRRLEHILLFALRALMLILIALLFANPFIRRDPSAIGGKKILVIAVDHSFSMRAADHLSKAKDEARSLIAGLKPGDQAQVLALSGTVQALTQLISDPAELRVAVESIQPGDSRASFGELARYVRTLSESTHLALEVHLVSDLQKTALPPGFADLRLDPSTTLVFHQIGKPVANFTVENVVAPARIFDPKKVRVQATIASFAAPEDKVETSKKNVSLVLNNKVLQTKTVDVPTGGRAQAEFLGLDAPYGFSRGEVRVEGADSLPADDRFYFAVERTDPRKVLFVDDGRQGHSQLYYRAALDSSGDSAFQMEVVRPEVAANQEFSHYAFVVLNNVGTVGAAFEGSLKKYVNAGGSVLIVLGPASAAQPKVPLTDDTIEASAYAGREGNRFFNVSEIDAGHPALRSVERFSGVKFYQAIHVTPSKSRVLARLNDQTPLILERQLGEGKVLVFTALFDNSTNDLPLHASWVPFVERSAAYLAGSGAEQPVNLVVDSYVELRAADSKSAAAEVLDPDGKRLLSLEEATTAKNFAVTKEGFFEMKAASGRHTLLAVHADRRESNLELIPQETLDLWRATGSDQSTAGTSGQGNEQDKKPWPLWPWLLLLLLIVAMAESLVADRHLRPAVENPESRRKEAA